MVCAQYLVPGWRCDDTDPQVFRLGLLRQCHEMARRDGFLGTDDGQLVERYGHKVAVVRGERLNLKVTFPEDLAVLSMVLEGHGEHAEKPGGLRRREGGYLRVQVQASKRAKPVEAAV